MSEQNAVHLASPDTYIKCAIQTSICLSVCYTFFAMFRSSYHHKIFRSYYHWLKWYPRKRSRSPVKVTEVKTQLSLFRTVTPVWIHIWRWNDEKSLMLLRRGALLFFKVIRQIWRSHDWKKHRFWPKSGVSGLLLKFKFIDGNEMMHQAWSSLEEMPYCFSRSSVK